MRDDTDVDSGVKPENTAPELPATAAKEAHKREQMALIANATAFIKANLRVTKNGSTIEGTLTPRELGALDNTQHIIAMKQALMLQAQLISDAYPNADMTASVAMLVTLFSDNRRGCCTVPITKMAALINRSVRSTTDAMNKAAKCGAIQRTKVVGGPYRSYPTVLAALVDPARRRAIACSRPTSMSRCEANACRKWDGTRTRPLATMSRNSIGRWRNGARWRRLRPPRSSIA